MTDDTDARAASAAHLRTSGLSGGDPLTLPLVMASTYNLPGDHKGLRTYGRSHNATWEALEALLGHLEGARALAFPSGMAAISAAMFALLKSGDRVLIPDDGYYTTRLLADGYLKKFGIAVEMRSTASFLDGGFDGFRLVYVETPSNPRLDICDLAAVARMAKAAGAITVADNTAMTPFGQRPLDFGINVVVAADTKAPNGHSDVLFGHVASRDETIMTAVQSWRDTAGAIPGPFEAWLLHRGLETLELRFDRMCRSAEIIAERLEAHPAVRSVRFPGLPSHPSHNLARAQMQRFGSLVSLTLEDGDKAQRFINGCALLQNSTSFGGLHSSAERRARWGDAVEPASCGFPSDASRRRNCGRRSTQRLRKLPAEATLSADQVLGNVAVAVENAADDHDIEFDVVEGYILADCNASEADDQVVTRPARARLRGQKRPSCSELLQQPHACCRIATGDVSFDVFDVPLCRNGQPVDHCPEASLARASAIFRSMKLAPSPSAKPLSIPSWINARSSSSV